MPFNPRIEDLVLMRSMAVDEFLQLPEQVMVKGQKTPVDGEIRATLSQMRAILRWLNRQGALDKKWIQKHGELPPEPIDF